MALKNKLFDYIKEQFREKWLKNQGDPSRVVSLLEGMNPNALVIGFCRRFATYKRAHLLFTNLERLSKIVNDPEHPVIFLFAGKAHPADGAGQGLIQRIYEISQRDEFLGKIIFLEDYDFLLKPPLGIGCRYLDEHSYTSAGGIGYIGREGRDERCSKPLSKRRLVA